MTGELAATYHSGAQRARVVTEAWARKIFSVPIVRRPNCRGWSRAIRPALIPAPISGFGERDRRGRSVWRPAKWNVRKCVRRDTERCGRDARAPLTVPIRVIALK